MFPKNTMMATSEAMPKEKLPVAEKRETAVVYVIDEKDPQGVERPESRNNRATIYACAVVLTTLILVAGTLGALAIVFPARGFDTALEPTPRHGGQQHGKNSQSTLPIPSTKPRVKIDDGGLWPANQFPVTPDLVFVKDGVDDNIKLGEDDNIKLGDGVLEPTDEGDVGDDDHDIVIDDPISSSVAQSSSTPDSSDLYNARNYISSSFPYDGFYMRGGVGDPPPRRGGSQASDSDTDDVTSSGDSSGDGDSTTAEYAMEDEYSPVASDSDDQDDQDASSTSSLPHQSSESSSSYSDPYIVSE